MPTNKFSSIHSYLCQSPLPIFLPHSSQISLEKWKLISLNIPKYHYLPLLLKWRLKSPRWPHAASPAHWKRGLLCWLCSDIPSSFIYPTPQTPPTTGHSTCLRGIPNLTCLQTSSWATAPYQFLSASSPAQYIKTHSLCCSVQKC